MQERRKKGREKGRERWMRREELEWGREREQRERIGGETEAKTMMARQERGSG